MQNLCVSSTRTMEFNLSKWCSSRIKKKRNENSRLTLSWVKLKSNTTMTVRTKKRLVHHLQVHAIFRVHLLFMSVNECYTRRKCRITSYWFGFFSIRRKENKNLWFFFVFRKKKNMKISAWMRTLRLFQHVLRTKISYWRIEKNKLLCIFICNYVERRKCKRVHTELCRKFHWQTW